MKNFYIKTLGCKTNQIESDLISEKLESLGKIKVDNIESADIFVLNSCSVTSTADNDALKILKRTKKENPNIYTILTGCFAQLEAENLKKYDFINLVLGNSEKMDIDKYLNSADTVYVSDIFAQKDFIYKKVEKPTKSRAYLKIQDGCNNRCSYCTIWKARGKSRSCTLNDIKEQVKIYTDNGFKEIVLTGIHIGQWGSDLSPQKSFMELIELIESTDIKRFRLGSLNPFELNDKLISHLAQSEKFCPHFHMSLQSACNKTLKSMNRHYTVEHYLEQIEQINEIFTLPFIGSDIIVGFPDESDKDFETTCINIENSGLTMAHVFPYSIRKNTVAAKMPNQISKEIKTHRASILRNIVSKKYESFILKNINTEHEVMFEQNKCKKTGYYKGLTENYITVYADTNTDFRNTLQKCVITDIHNNLPMVKTL